MKARCVYGFVPNQSRLDGLRGECRRPGSVGGKEARAYSCVVESAKQVSKAVTSEDFMRAYIELFSECVVVDMECSDVCL